MWRKNLILSLVIAMDLPFGKAGAAPTGLQDEAQPQVSTGDKGVTTVPAIETALAVPADVKWAHRLATVFAALGAIAGVVQLWYIWKYWGEIKEKFTEPRWDCKEFEEIIPPVTRAGNEDNPETVIQSTTVSGWTPDANILLLGASQVGIMTPVCALATGWLYRHTPVLKPETIFTHSPLENIAKFLGVVWVVVIATKIALYILTLGVSRMFNPKVSKGFAVQIAAFGGMLLCKGYEILRVMYLNHKAAEALDQSIIAA